jgi:hypothetical protein
MEAPGYQDFRKFLNVEIGKDFVPEAIEEVIRRLARMLQEAFEEVRRLSMIEALEIF